MEAVLATYTEKSALAVARATYDGLLSLLVESSTEPRARVATRVHREGAVHLARLDSRATDLALSVEAVLAFEYFLEAARLSDASGQIAWLEQLPLSIAGLLERPQADLPYVDIGREDASGWIRRPARPWAIRVNGDVRRRTPAAA